MQNDDVASANTLAESPMHSADEIVVVVDAVEMIPAGDEIVTHHRYASEDDFTERELELIADAKGWGSSEKHLLVNGPSSDPSSYYPLMEMSPGDAEEAAAEAEAWERNQYAELMSEALDFREREQRAGRWRYEDETADSFEDLSVTLFKEQCRYVSVRFLPSPCGRVRRPRRVVRSGAKRASPDGELPGEHVGRRHLHCAGVV